MKSRCNKASFSHSVNSPLEGIGPRTLCEDGLKSHPYYFCKWLSCQFNVGMFSFFISFFFFFFFRFNTAAREKKCKLFRVFLVYINKVENNFQDRPVDLKSD